MIKVDEETEVADTSLWVTEDIHIRVNDSGIAVVRDDGIIFAFYDCSNRTESIISSLRKAINDSQTII